MSLNIIKASFVFRCQSSWQSRPLPIYIHPWKVCSQINEIYVSFQVRDNSHFLKQFTKAKSMKNSTLQHQHRKHPLRSYHCADSVLPKPEHPLSTVVHVSGIKLHCKWWSGNTRLYYDSVQVCVTLLTLVESTKSPCWHGGLEWWTQQ